MPAVFVYSSLVCILDIFTPLGIEVWVLNLPVLLVPVWLQRARMVLPWALASSVFLIAGWLLSPDGGYNPPLWDTLNRLMGLLTIWMMAGVAILVIQRTRELGVALDSLGKETARRERLGRALETSEDRLRLAMEGAGMGTFEVDLIAGTVVWSTTCLRIIGYDSDGPHETPIELWRTFIHPDDRARILDARETARRLRSVYSEAYRVIRADTGKIVWLSVVGRYYYDGSGVAFRFLGVAFDITERMELQRQAAERETLAIAAREQERIGQELHDGVGQEVTGLGLMAGTLVERLPAGTREHQIAARVVSGLDSVHKHVRELSHGLIPVHLESRGLAAALEDLAVRTADATGIEVTSDCSEGVDLQDHEASIQMFRIAQEAVANAVKHGRPRHVRIGFRAEAEAVRLSVADDGVGITTASPRGTGIGLRIMKNRASQIGGALDVGPAPGGGTVVSCTLASQSGWESKPETGAAG